MKKLHKLLTVLLTMILVLECFTVPALATETELETVPDETTISEPEVPAESEEAPQEPTEPETTPQEPTEPETTPQEPTEPVTTPQEPTEPETTPQEPTEPEKTPQEPTEPETTPQEPTEPETTPQEPTEPEKTVQILTDSETKSVEIPQEPTIVGSGTCGENLTWTLDSEGLLTISGEGEMYAYYGYMVGKQQPWNRSAVKKVVIESGVTSVGNEAFDGDYHYNLTEVYLPDTLTRIEYAAFSDTRITQIVIPESVEFIGSSAFNGCKYLTSINLPEGITELRDSVLSGCSSLETLVIPESVTVIGRYALAACSSLTDFVLPSKLSHINEGAFRNCKSLDVIILPDSVTTIEQGAFSGCVNLTLAYLPVNLTVIPNALFNGCTSLEAFFLPAKVTKIEPYAFENCKSLKEIYYLGTEKQLGKIAVYQGNEPLLKATIYLVTIVTKQPQDVKAAAGKTAKFTTAANRSGVKYQWYYQKPGSAEWKACSGDSAKKATLTINVKANMDGYQYYCVIKDAYGGIAETQSATLTVVPAPKITKQPESAMAKIGKNVSVTVEAEGEGLTYLWYYANKGSTSFKKTSNTTNTYTIEMTSSRNGRKLYCVVKDKYGQSVKSETVTIYRETTPIVITQQPESVNAKYGEKVTLTAGATGDGLTYTWYYAKAGAKKFSKSSTTTSSYSVVMSADRDGRQLYCLIKDAYGKKLKTDTVVLKIDRTPLNLTKEPENVTVKYGEKAAVSVEAEGDGLTYTWYYTKAGEKKFSKSSVTASTYSVTMKKAQDGRKVYCVIKDAYGKKIKTDTVVLKIDRTPLALTKAPEDVVVKSGKKAEISVLAEGDGLTYTWYYTKAGEKKFTKSSTTGKTYSVTMKKSLNGRKVYCVIKDAYGKKIKTDTVTIRIDTSNS